MSLDGILVVDKPQGITSLDVVREIKRRFPVKKAGHIGTLDPFATGVLPLVINEATKLVPFLQEDPKHYEAMLKLGEETDTDDLTGQTIRIAPWESLDPERIQSTIESFIGTIRQIPPMFSAIKVNGRPLYQLARKGIEVRREEREVKIFSLQIEAIKLPIVHLNLSCSKGTYIRALARDIGRELGCGAHLISLRRIRSGPFTIEEAIPLRKVKTLWDQDDLRRGLIPLREALFNLPEMVGDDRLIRKVRYGQEMVAGDLDLQTLPPFEAKQWVKMSSPEDGLVAILQPTMRKGEVANVDPERVVFRPVRVFHHKKDIQQGESIFHSKEAFHGIGSGKEKRDHRSV